MTSYRWTNKNGLCFIFSRIKGYSHLGVVAAIRAFHLMKAGLERCRPVQESVDFKIEKSA